MKNTLFNICLVGTAVLMATVSCKKDDDATPAPAAIVYYEGGDQMARPAINTVFVDAPAKDSFNNTIPSMMAGKFTSKFKTRLLALNPKYSTNALGLTSDQLSAVLVTDVLNVSTTGNTKFFTSPSDYLTGRGLEDDVIDNELTLIFGGPTGGDNAALTKDNVNSNDKSFSVTFPYLASPW